MRIAVFLYDWAMRGYTRDLVVGFAERGNEVDFFYKDPASCPNTFAEVDELALNPGVRFFNLRPRHGNEYRFTISKLMRKTRMQRVHGKLVDIWPCVAIDKGVLNQSRRIVDQSRYDCFIGIEKLGLIWAGILSDRVKCPLIYYSLELYIEDHPELSNFSFLREAEKKYHRKASATIIQDDLRGAALLESNGVSDLNVPLYFPISVRGDVVKGKSKFLHRKLGIDENKRIVLYFGSVFPRRYLEPLVEISKNFTDDTVLVILGDGTNSFREQLRSMAEPEKAIVSDEFIPESHIQDILSSADFGIALFQTSNANDRLVAFSCHKVSYYLQCGVPVIMFETESSQRLMGAYACGALINSVDEIPEKIRAMLANYENYHQQAHLAFNAFFSFDRTFDAMYTQLSTLLGNGLQDSHNPPKTSHHTPGKALTLGHT